MLKILIVLFAGLLLFCDDKNDVEELKSSTDKVTSETSLEGFMPACTTITDDVTIKIFSSNSYTSNDVTIKVTFENMAAKPYYVCKNMKLNFPLYPVITPSVKIKDVVDSMDYQFDTLAPGEIVTKHFNFSRYCKFEPGDYKVRFLYTTNAEKYKDEKMMGMYLNDFTLKILD